MTFLQSHPANISLFPLDGHLTHLPTLWRPSRDGWAAQFESWVWEEVARVRAQMSFRAQTGQAICFYPFHQLKAHWAQQRRPKNCPTPTDLWYAHHLHYCSKVWG